MGITRSSNASLLGLPARLSPLQWVIVLGFGTAVLVAGCTADSDERSTSADDCRNYFTASDLTPDDMFTQPLPVPNRLAPTYTDPSGTDGGRPVYVLHARAFTWEPVPGVCIPKWGFEGTTPGPTLTAEPGREVEVLVYNELPDTLYNPYLDPFNQLAWRNPPAPNRTSYTMFGPSPHRPPAPFDAPPYALSQYELDPDLTVHLHGGHQTPENDGYPMDTFEPGASRVYSYPNNQLPTTLWYHDHDMDHTRGHVLMGLAGFYLIEDHVADKQLGLPTGESCERSATPIPSVPTATSPPSGPGDCDEIPIMFQAVPAEMIDDEAYQPVAYTHGPSQPPPYQVLWTANNTIAPYLTVENKPYRLRLLNGNDELPLTVWTSTDPDDPDSTPDGAFLQQVGSDGGVMNSVAVASPPEETKVRLFPAQRADVVLDFSDIREPTTIYLQAATGQAFVGGPGPNCITAVCPFGDNVDQNAHPLIKFVVEPTIDPAPPAFDPPKGELRGAGSDPIVKIPIRANGKPVPERSFLFAFNGQVGKNPFATINGRFFDPHHTYATPVVNTTEVWRLINSTDGYHPIHIHDIEFQVVSRAVCRETDEAYVGTQTDPDRPYDQWCKTPRRHWKKIHPQPGDWADCQKHHGAAKRCNLGWKDVFVIPPYSEVRVIGTFADNLGTYVFHCHNLIHEDAGMMGQFEVVADEAHSHEGMTE